MRNWVPAEIEKPDGERSLCRWTDTSDVRFDEPFFEHSLMFCRAKISHERRAFRSVSELSFLPMAAGQVEAVSPSAFIFHISRCGSTLFTQMLGQDERNLVLSEVPFFDQLLRLENLPENQRDDFFRAAVQLTGQKRFGTEERLIIKADSWHLFFHRKIRQLYPDVPFILLYRKPEPVLISHAKRRGMHMLPSFITPDFFGVAPLSEEHPNLDEYAASVLETFYRKMQEIVSSDPNSVLVSYDAGITDEFFRACRFSRLSIDPEMENKMRERSRFHSKEPANVFAGDAKQEISRIDFSRLDHLYRELEEMRLAKR